MALPATPTKRVLTEDAHSAFRASRSPYNGIISDDLTARLQNIGSRVRKCVNEGYATTRFGSVPPTPFSSPVKPSSTSNASSGSPIFRSANDTLFNVFSSPTRVVASAPSPLPLPRKRGRAEIDDKEEEEENLVLGLVNLEPEDIMMDMETGSDEEDVTIITNTASSPSRPMRPLKKSSRVLCNTIPPFVIAKHPNVHSPGVSDSSLIHGNMATPVNKEWKNMFDQPF
ncbi:hypothetical protein M0805_006968 [Coniferiporia weirii]|nr:hypothetical protein M0805_006968 [Coniferiporia weirii]